MTILTITEQQRRAEERIAAEARHEEANARHAARIAAAEAEILGQIYAALVALKAASDTAETLHRSRRYDEDDYYAETSALGAAALKAIAKSRRQLTRVYGHLWLGLGDPAVANAPTPREIRQSKHV
jgi:hypothetical protein